MKIKFTSRHVNYYYYYYTCGVFITWCLGVCRTILLEDIVSATGYDRRVWPTAHLGKATLVNVSVYVTSIDELDELNSALSLDIFFRSSWHDVRLLQPNVTSSMTLRSTIPYTDLHDIDFLWTPNLYFYNAKRGQMHTVTRPNIYLNVDFNTGNLILSQRFSTVLHCDLDLKLYPLDTQICFMRIESYGYNKSQLDLAWKGDGISLDPEVHLPKFIIRDHLARLYDSIPSVTYEGIQDEFVNLNASLTLEREIGYHIMQTYIPTSVLVIISWIDFLLDPGAVPARITLSLTTLLTITTLSYGIQRKVPDVSYIKAIDIWLLFCMTMIFGVIVEFTLVQYIARRDLKRVMFDDDKSMAPRHFEDRPSYGRAVSPDDFKDENNLGIVTVRQRRTQNSRSSTSRHPHFSPVPSPNYPTSPLSPVLCPDFPTSPLSPELSPAISTSPNLPVPSPDYPMPSSSTVNVKSSQTKSVDTVDNEDNGAKDEIVENNKVKVDYHIRARKVDIVSRYLFPSVFILFVIFYAVVTYGLGKRKEEQRDA